MWEEVANWRVELINLIITEYYAFKISPDIYFIFVDICCKKIKINHHFNQKYFRKKLSRQAWWESQSNWYCESLLIGFWWHFLLVRANKVDDDGWLINEKKLIFPSHLFERCNGLLHILHSGDEAWRYWAFIVSSCLLDELWHSYKRWHFTSFLSFLCLYFTIQVVWVFLTHSLTYNDLIQLIN